MRRPARRSNLRAACCGNACFITRAPCAARRSHKRSSEALIFLRPTERLTFADQATARRRPSDRPPSDQATVRRPTERPSSARPSDRPPQQSPRRVLRQRLLYYTRTV